MTSFATPSHGWIISGDRLGNNVDRERREARQAAKACKKRKRGELFQSPLSDAQAPNFKLPSGGPFQASSRCLDSRRLVANATGAYDDAAATAATAVVTAMEEAAAAAMAATIYDHARAAAGDNGAGAYDGADAAALAAVAAMATAATEDAQATAAAAAAVATARHDRAGATRNDDGALAAAVATVPVAIGNFAAAGQSHHQDHIVHVKFLLREKGANPRRYPPIPRFLETW
jgi:hypothetical protein